MTEQARPFKNMQNRLETLGAAPAAEVAEAPERVRDQAEVVGREQEPPAERRTVLDSLLASGWLDWEKVIWLVIIALALVSRLWDLSPRALHHDESIHGVFSYDMFSGRNVYRYDPTWHGPWLYYMVSLSYFMFGVNEFGLRFAPAIYGVGLIAICWLLRPLIGRIGAIAFAVLMLVSPSILYYSRSLRHDIFATFGMLLFVVSLFRFAQAKAGKRGAVWWMVPTGLGFFILFASHEMSFLNLAIVLSWLGAMFLLEIVVLPAWVRREARKTVVVAEPSVAEANLDEGKVITPAQFRRVAAEDDDELEDLEPLKLNDPVEPLDVADSELEEPIALNQSRLAGFEDEEEASAEEEQPLFEEKRPVLGRRSAFGEEPDYKDPIFGNFRLVWGGLFALFALLTLAGSVHLFSDKTYDGTLIQFLGVNAYIIWIPMYLAIFAGLTFLLAKLATYGYNRLSPRSNLIARITAGGSFVALTIVALLLFLRGKAPTGYLADVGSQLSNTGSPAIKATVQNGFSGFNEFSYGGLKWFSILPELVVIAVAALLLGTLVGWLWERRLLVYTERGFYGFGITAFFIMLLASLVSIRFILVTAGTERPKVVLPLLGFIDKWQAYVIGGVLLAVVVGFVAGWFVSLAELIPDSALRGSAVLRAVLKFARQPWSVAALLLAFGIPYILIFSNFFFTPERLADGFYRGIEYWLEQHDKRRLDEPWFYYPMLMLLYEILAVVLYFVALFYFPIVWWKRSAQRGRLVFTAKGVFIGLTFWWAFAALVMYSIAGEKIPWLNMQIAMPTSLVAAIFLNDYLRSIEWRRIFRVREGLLFAGTFILMFAATLVMIGMAINFPRVGQLNTGINQTVSNNEVTTAVIQMVLVGAVALALFGFSLWLWLSDRLRGQTARAVILLLTCLGLFAYCLKSTISLNYDHPDVAIEPMIYTQTTPEIPLFAERLDRLSRDIRDTYKTAPAQTQPNELPAQYPDPANSKGIPLYVSTGVDWPLHWYLRDYTDVSYQAVRTDANQPPLDKLTDARGNNYAMIMISADENTSQMQQELAGQYTAETYKFRWFFPEDASGYGGLGYQPPDDYRENRIAVKDISNTRWDMILRSFTEQPYAGRLWRYVMYRQLWQPLQSYDMVVYVRNDLYPDFALTGGASTGGTGTSGQTDQNSGLDLTVSSQSGNRNGQYNTPRNIAIAPSGDIYVLDSLNGRVQHFDKDGHFIGKFGTLGAGDGQFSLQQYQSGPGGIAIDDEGNVYVADTWGYRIEKFDKTGKFLLKWGEGQDVSSDPQKAQQMPTAFYGPRSIAFDKSTGELYITDTGNKRIVVYDKNGQFKRQIGSKGNGPGQFDEPVAVAIGPDGNLYVTDQRNRRVEVVDKQGKFVKDIAVPSWKDAVLSEPYLAFGPNGDLFVSDPTSSQILGFDQNGQQVQAYGPSTGLALINPVGLAFDSDGNLYVADAKRNAIVKFKP